MADLKNNELSAEEKEAGFNVGEPDDDTFSLKDSDDYPGQSDDFIESSKDNISELETPEKEIRTEEQDLNVERKDDVIDSSENIPSVVSSEENLVNEDKSTEDRFIKEIQQSDKENQAQKSESFQSESDAINIPDDEIKQGEVDTPVSEIISPEKVNEKEIFKDAKSIEELDLASFIQEQKDKTEKRKSGTSDENLDEESNIPTDFKPVEENVADVQFIDLTTLDADDIQSKTKKVQENFQQPLIEDEPTQTQISDENSQKKKRSILPIAISIVATLLVCILIAGLYMFIVNPEVGELIKKEFAFLSTEEKQEIGTQKSESIVEKLDETMKETEVAIIDTAEKEILIQQDTSTLIKEPKIETEKKEEAPKRRMETSTGKPIKVEPKFQPKKPKDPKELNIPPIKPEEQKIKTEPKPKDELVAKVVPENIVNIPKQETTEKIAINETYTDFEDEGIYTVQIYSSPSKPDAEEWLKKLKAKNITNAFISTQQIRGQVWYRVRFGEFTSKEEARLAALRYGFAQTWIDRIK